jgi:phenylalanyl-tRNA synthetase beta chain
MNLIADALTGSGYFEAITFSFVTDNLSADFLPPSPIATGLPRADPATRKADANLRPSLLPGLLEALARNEAAGNGPVQLYETGSAFHLGANSELIETRKLALVGGGGGGGDTHALRGTLESLLTRLDARRPLHVQPTKSPGFDVAATLVWGDTPIGIFGLISKSLVKKLDLRHTPAAAELDLAPLLTGTRHVPQLNPLPKFPAVERDVSLVVSEELPYNALSNLISSLNLAHLESTNHITTYRGKPLEKGTKSVSIRLQFRAADRSLKAEEVDHAVNAFIDASRSTLNATIRT